MSINLYTVELSITHLGKCSHVLIWLYTSSRTFKLTCVKFTFSVICDFQFHKFAGVQTDVKNVVKNLLNGGQRSALQNKKTFWDRLCTAIKHNLNADRAVNISKPLLLLNCMQCNVYTSTELICIKNQLQCMDRMHASRPRLDVICELRVS